MKNQLTTMHNDNLKQLTKEYLFTICVLQYNGDSHKMINSLEAAIYSNDLELKNKDFVEEYKDKVRQGIRFMKRQIALLHEIENDGIGLLPSDVNITGSQDIKYIKVKKKTKKGK